MLLFDVDVEKVEMAEEACTNLPSALPSALPCAQVGGAQVAPHAVKKRKRGTDIEGQAPHCNTGQQSYQSLLPMRHPCCNVFAAVLTAVVSVAAFTMKLLCNNMQ